MTALNRSLSQTLEAVRLALSRSTSRRPCPVCGQAVGATQQTLRIYGIDFHHHCATYLSDRAQTGSHP